jgi:hypothetical protein
MLRGAVTDLIDVALRSDALGVDFVGGQVLAFAVLARLV